MLGYLTDPFQYPFMQRALLEVLLLSIPAGLLGCWIVLRRLSFLTHAVGAATFPGLVLGFGLGVQPVARRVRRRGRVRRRADAARAPRAARSGRDHRSPARHLPRGGLRSRLERVPLVRARSTACCSGACSGSTRPTSTAHSCSTWRVSRWCSSRGAGCSRHPSRRRPRESLGYRRGRYDAVLLLVARCDRRLVRGGDRRLRRVGPARRPGCDGAASRALGAADAGRRRAAGCGRGDGRPRARVPPRRPARRRHRRARRVGLPGRRDRRAVAARSPRATASRAWRSRARCSRRLCLVAGHGRRQLPRAARRARIAVVATTTQLQDLVRNVGGTRVLGDGHPEAERRPARVRAEALGRGRAERREADRRIGRRARRAGWAS